MGDLDGHSTKLTIRARKEQWLNLRLSSHASEIWTRLSYSVTLPKILCAGPGGMLQGRLCRLCHPILLLALKRADHPSEALDTLGQYVFVFPSKTHPTRVSTVHRIMFAQTLSAPSTMAIGICNMECAAMLQWLQDMAVDLPDIAFEMGTCVLRITGHLKDLTLHKTVSVAG